MPGLKPQAAKFTVNKVNQLSAEQTERVWEIYTVCSSGLAVVAAARHVMGRDEFDAMVSNPDVIKLLAVDDDGEVAGMALLTNDLDSVDWISPDFFRRRYPAHAATNTIYYLAFAAVHPDQRGIGLLPMLTLEVARHVSDLGGVACFDVCQFNEEVVPVKDIGPALMPDQVPFTMVPIDYQQWYAVEFDSDHRYSKIR